MDNIINRELLKLENEGSFFSIEERIIIHQNIKSILKKIKEYENILNYYKNRLEKITERCIASKSLHGISSITLLDDDEINIIKGKTFIGKKIDDDVYFDIASITKLFTLFLYFTLENENVICREEKVGEIMPCYKYLKNYKIDDILYMRGEIRTPKRIDECFNKNEALKVLYDTYIYNDDFKTFKYTDIGLIILARIIEEKLSKIHNKKLLYNEIMDMYLLKKYNFESNYVVNGIISGSGRCDNKPNDSKARIIGPTGHAGIFMKKSDVKKIRDLLFYKRVFDEKQIELLYKSYSRPKSIAGLYQKYYDNSKTYVPSSYSNKSFASEGYTGSTLIFDLENKIINGIFVDAIKEGETKKSKKFKDCISKYQKEVTDLSIEAKVLKKVYNQIYF